MSTKQQTKFSPGQILATPGAFEALECNHNDGKEYLRRHLTGDWGIVCAADREANDQALHTGARLLSAYLLPDETKLWVITDAADDEGRRPATTLLLPEEY